LTLRLDDEVAKAAGAAKGETRAKSSAPRKSAAPKRASPSSGGALAEALRRAGEKSGGGKPRR
jgi:uncharacterized protein